MHGNGASPQNTEVPPDRQMSSLYTGHCNGAQTRFTVEHGLAASQPARQVNEQCVRRPLPGRRLRAFVDVSPKVPWCTCASSTLHQ